MRHSLAQLKQTTAEFCSGRPSQAHTERMLSRRAAQLLLLAGLAAAFQRPALRYAAPRTALRASASDVTIDKDFRLALGTCGVALVLDQIPIIKWLPGLPLTLLGLLFLIQT